VIPEQLKHFVEAALLCAGRPLPGEELLELLAADGAGPSRAQLDAALDALRDDWRGRALELVEVAGGLRAQVRAEYSERIGRLWAERPGRYSRALLETLALIAYRQPVTRGEIEEVRGVSVSSSIVKTLMEREWVRVVGHREVPGRPALFGTTRTFLDDFGLKELADLPSLAEVRDLAAVESDLFDLLPPSPAPAAPPTAVEPDADSAAGERPETVQVTTEDPLRRSAEGLAESLNAAPVDPAVGRVEDDAGDPD